MPRIRSDSTCLNINLPAELMQQVNAYSIDTKLSKTVITEMALREYMSKISVDSNIGIKYTKRQPKAYLLRSHCIDDEEADAAISVFPALCEYTVFVEHKNIVFGRELYAEAIMKMFAGCCYNNVMLTGPAGIGKKAIVREVAMYDHKRLYLDVDIPKMTADTGVNINVLARYIDEVIIEAKEFAKKLRVDHDDVEVVLCFNNAQLLCVSETALYVINKYIDDNENTGIRFMFTATDRNFGKSFGVDVPFVHKLNIINVMPLDHKDIVNILKDHTRRSGVDTVIADNDLYDDIIAAAYDDKVNAQPLSSIILLDRMTGVYRSSMQHMGFDADLIDLAINVI